MLQSMKSRRDGHDVVTEQQVSRGKDTVELTNRPKDSPGLSEPVLALTPSNPSLYSGKTAGSLGLTA